MSWTKLDLISQAFEEIGMAADVFDLTPEMLQSALRRMDAMVGGWEATGVRIGYSMPTNPSDSSLAGDSGVPSFANEAIFLGLAVRLAPGYGKIIPPVTMVLARTAYNNMVRSVVEPTPERQLPTTTPLGQGNKPWSGTGRFVTNQPETIDVGPDGPIEFT